ncbi:IS3 family transposase [Methylococcus geothermalis]|nr:IS3 family transposase [Methylococcus geothermalis]
MARWRRRPGKGLLVPSDRGSPYASGRFQTRLKDPGYLCSMSRNGNGWDNAPAESFFPTLKTELIPHRRFETREQAKQEIFEYLEVFYHRQRKHSTLGDRTPAEFDQLHRQSCLILCPENSCQISASWHPNASQNRLMLSVPRRKRAWLAGLWANASAPPFIPGLQSG